MNYKVVETICHTSHSSIYKIKDINQYYALKKLKSTEEGVADVALCEIAILQSLNHPYIICCHDIILGVDTCLILDYCDYSLTHYIKNNSFNLNLFNQICEGLLYIHNQFIIHRDLKPDNILIKNETIKIADFGLARWASTNLDYSFHVVTLFYRAPEILLKQPYSFGIDIWALGCIYVEMMTKVPPFTGFNNVELLNDIYNQLKTNKELRKEQLVNDMLCLDVKKRITIKQIVTLNLNCNGLYDVF
jgi:serine/threonine protein kinase